MNRPKAGMQRGRIDAPGFILVIIGLLAELLLLLGACRYSDFFVAGNASRFVPMALAAGLFYLVATGSFEKMRPSRRGVFLWSAAIVLRVAVFWMPPCADLWGYLWDGKIQLHGFNPYLVNPQDPSVAFLRDFWWSKINLRDHAAIYPPGVELLFRAMARVSLSPFFFKALFAVADLGVISLLLKLNTGSGRYRVVAWYAWNPAVVLAFAGAGHYDSIFLLALVAAVLALHRANPLGACPPAVSWACVSSVLLGVAISLNTIAVFLVPLWIFALGKRFYTMALSAAVAAGLVLPFGGITVLTRSLAPFTTAARFNDLLWWAVDRVVLLRQDHQNILYFAILLVTVAVLSWCFRKDWRRGMLWVFAAVLILTPVLHPWYVTWILPLACWRRAWAWFVFALSVQLAYTQWDDTVFGAAWSDSSILLRMLMVVPPLLVCAWQFRSSARESISV